VAWRLLVHATDVPGSTRCRVIAKLSPGFWRVILGVGEPRHDGGVECDWPEEELPASARFPNAEFFLTGQR